MLTRTARVALNTFTNYVRFGIALAVFFLLTPYVIRKVGESDFGLWSFSWAVLNCFILLDLGYGTGVVKYVAEYKGSNDPERRNRMLSTLAVVYAFLALLAAVLIYAFSLVFLRLFSIPSEQHSKAIALLWILGARLAILGLPLGIFRGILFGDQRILLVNAVQIAATLIYGLGSWLVLAFGYGLVALAWVNLAAMVAEHLAYLALSYLCLERLRI